MNGERQLNAFIDNPCKATLLPFVKSIFTARDPAAKELRRIKSNRCTAWKTIAARWRESRCDMFHHHAPFEGCKGCPFQVDTNEEYFHLRLPVQRCYFTSKFRKLARSLPGLSNGTINQHQWPKLLMADLAFILMGAVKLRNALELRKEEKMCRLDSG